MKKSFLITIWLLTALLVLGVSCKKSGVEEPATPPVEEKTPAWPVPVTLNVVGGESISLFIEPNMEWSVTLSDNNAGLFWLMNNGSRVESLSGGEGRYNVIVGVSDDNLGITGVATVSMKMKNETRTIATITRPGLSGEYPDLVQANVYGSGTYDLVIAPNIDWTLELSEFSDSETSKQYFWIVGDNNTRLTETSGGPGSRHIYVGHSGDDADLTVKCTLTMTMITDSSDDMQESRAILSLTRPGLSSLFPAEESKSMAGGEEYTFEASFPMDWELKLSSDKYFSMSEGTAAATSVKGKGGESKSIRFKASESDPGVDGKASVSLTMGGTTKTILQLVRPAVQVDFPDYKEVEIAAEEKYKLEVNMDSPFKITIPSAARTYFHIEDGTQQSYEVSYGAGYHEINICSKPNTLDFDNDHECVVSMTMSGVTKDILKITVRKLERTLKLYRAVLDPEYEGWKLNSDGSTFYEEIPAGSPIEFVFNPYGNRNEFMIRIKAEASFQWNVNKWPAWIDEESLLNANERDADVRDLLLDTSKLNLDGMNGEITFTDISSGVSAVEVVTYSVSVPSSRDIAYAYFDYYIDDDSVAALQFDSAGQYVSGDQIAEQASGIIVGQQSAKLCLAGPTADASSWQTSPSYANIEYEAWAAGSPLQARAFTLKLSPNAGYTRNMYLLLFADGTIPSDLVSADGLNQAYAANVVATINQQGDAGYADGRLLDIMDQAGALLAGAKFEKLDGSSDTAQKIRSTLNSPDLEVWDLTYKTVNDTSAGWPMPTAYAASFRVTGYGFEDLNGKANDHEETQALLNALGISNPLNLSMLQHYANKTYFGIEITDNNPAAGREGVMVLYSDYDADNAESEGTPVIAFHVIYNPNAAF